MSHCFAQSTQLQLYSWSIIIATWHRAFSFIWPVRRLRFNVKTGTDGWIAYIYFYKERIHAFGKSYTTRWHNFTTTPLLANHKAELTIQGFPLRELVRSAEKGEIVGSKKQQQAGKQKRGREAKWKEKNEALSVPCVFHDDPCKLYVWNP